MLVLVNNVDSSMLVWLLFSFLPRICREWGRAAKSFHSFPCRLKTHLFKKYLTPPLLSLPTESSPLSPTSSSSTHSNLSSLKLKSPLPLSFALIFSASFLCDHSQVTGMLLGPLNRSFIFIMACLHCCVVAISAFYSLAITVNHF